MDAMWHKCDELAWEKEKKEGKKLAEKKLVNIVEAMQPWRVSGGPIWLLR